MKENRIAITGMGIVSAIGMNLADNLHALVTNSTGISRVDNFETIHRDMVMVGEIKQSNAELAALLDLPAGHCFSRTSLLGALAARQALEHAQIKDVNAVRTGFISSTSVGGMDITERNFYAYAEDPSLRPYITAHDAGDTTHKIADYLGLQGFVSTISTACSSAANAIMLGARLLLAGKVDRVVVGGTDALCKFTLNGFNTLMILSDAPCTPFDQNRKGLNLGEAAAYLVLESEAMVQRDNKEVLAYLSGYGNANDAYHQTASSEDGEGAFRAMQKAFAVAALEPAAIDYINVHGTATANNDLSEGRAIHRIFGDSVADFSSTKAFTGHTLAAAAAIEAVFSVLALQQQVVFPNLNFTTAMEEFTLIPATEIKHKPIHHVLSNSFGFGGNCSTLIFSKA